MKKYSLLYLLIFLVNSLSAQVIFEKNNVVDRSSFHASAITNVMIDFDQDGDEDYLYVDFPYNLYLFENVDGSGENFVQRKIAEDLDRPNYIDVADIDNDGDYDIIFASSNNKVIVLENIDGYESFDQKQAMTAWGVDFVVGGDPDNDGDIDIFWSASDEGKMGYMRNDGEGNFPNLTSPTTITSTVVENHDYTLADLNDDGKIDILSSYESGYDTFFLTWHKNIFNGGATAYTPSNRITIAEGARNGRAADLDGDGDLDVVARDVDSGELVWFENLDGEANFSEANTLTNNPEGTSDFILGDFDGDNDIDVIAKTPYGTNKIFMYKNEDGVGTFGSPILVAEDVLNIRDIFVTDLNNDNQLDFVYYTSYSLLRWYKNTDGLANFSEINITKNFSGARTTFAADMDGDGDLDVISGSHWDDKVAWYENLDGNGDFTRSQKIISISTTNGVGRVWAADLDGDGDNDVLATSSLDDTLVWFENLDGLGNFGPSQLIDDDFYDPEHIYAIDIDNDTDQDVLLGVGGNIYLYKNQGDGSFATRVAIDSQNNRDFNAIEFADLDGDNDLDLIVSVYYDIFYYFNTDGQGNFGPRQVYDISGISEIEIADFNGDNHNDIAFIKLNQTGDRISWAANDGSGVFGSENIVATGLNNPEDIIAMDVDQDGDMDIVSSEGYFQRPIAWYDNSDGQGSFVDDQQFIYLPGSVVPDILAADINQDNNLDIVFFSDLELGWLNNRGNIPTNEINGTIRLDLTGDGCDSADELLEGLMVVSTGPTNTFATFTNSNGQFQINSSDEGAITTQITSQLPNHYQANPANYESNFTGFNNVDQVNFCIEPVASINDVSVAVYPLLRQPRPGFDTTYQLVYENKGTTVLSGSVTFEFDESKVQFLSASETVSSQSAGILTFDYVDLDPFEKRTVQIEVNVLPPPTNNIDEILVTNATISPISGDDTEDDNVFELQEVLVGSYDPNDIRVLEGDEIDYDDIDKYLNYIIRFQNTGTASAINVRVEHSLDDKLDWTSMKLQSLSHDGTVSIRNGRDIEFLFENINLPDSISNEPESHGFITFKIKPKTNVEIGDIISGVADIYFDYNLPITTNTVTTEIKDNPLSTTDIALGEFTLYPNPASTMIRVRSSAIIDEMNLYDIKGRIIGKFRVDKLNPEINISNLAHGMYFVKIKSGNKQQTLKFIKR